MKLNVLRKLRSGFVLTAAGLLGTSSLFALYFLLVCSPAVAASGKVVSNPDISIVLEPYTADGQMRLYPVDGGISYWTNDLPIYQGDSVKIDVFVATGADELQRLKVRVDNNLVADLTKGPWNTTLSTAKLGAGYHFIEAWAQVSGPKRQFPTKSQQFFISTSTAPLQPVQPVTQVNGQEQVLNGGQVVTVPLPNSPAADPPDPAPAKPQIISTSGDAPDAKVAIVLKDAATGKVIDTTEVVHLSSASVASVAPSAGSTAHRFAYELVSSHQVLTIQDKLYSTDVTNIRLQPRTESVPGLLPGETALWVWGIDNEGNSGAPVCVKLQIDTPSGG